MGAYASQFRAVSGQAVSEFSHPSKPDWVTAHATATGLAIVEVERVWKRFQQLGCNEDGILTSDVLTREPASEDIFCKNILTTMRAEDKTISFQTYLSALKWAETSTMEQRLRGVFHLLNGGNPIPREILVKILAKLYPEDAKEALEELADRFITQMDKSHTGSLTEEDFVRWLKGFPAAEFRPYLDFNIVPPDINEEAQRAFTAANSLQTSRQTSMATRRPAERPAGPQDPPREVVTDGHVRQVVERVRRRDWRLLANKLDFTEHEVTEVEKRLPADVSAQVTELLTLWRQREGQSAYVTVLQDALRNSSMNDIALML